MKRSSRPFPRIWGRRQIAQNSTPYVGKFAVDRYDTGHAFIVPSPTGTLTEAEAQNEADRINGRRRIFDGAIELGYVQAPTASDCRFLAVVYGPGGSETALSSPEACEGHIRAAWAALQSR